MEDYETIEEEKPSLLKRIIISFLAIFLILLFTSFLLTNFEVRHILAGLITSSTLGDDFTIRTHDIVVEFSQEALSDLDKLYQENRNVEFSACLFGTKDNNYFINKVIQPKTYQQSYNKVVSEPCQKEALIHLHSHPYRRCIPSQQDITTFNIFKKQRENALMIVMCEPKRFNVVR